MATAPDWATPTEAAAILGVKRQAVYNQIANGTIPQAALRPRLKKGDSIFIDRAYLAAPGKIVQFPTESIHRLHPDDIQRIADAVAERLATGLMGRNAS